MKKRNNFALFIGVGLMLSSFSAEAQSHMDQYEQAESLKEGTYYGYYDENRKGCSDTRYKLDAVKPTVSNIQKEGGKVQSFVFDCGLSYSNETLTLSGPNSDAKTAWDEKVVIYNGDIYVLSADPYYNSDFCISRWYTKGKVGLGKAFKIAAAYEDGTLAPPVTVDELKNYLAPLIAARKAVDDAKQEERNAELAAHKAKYSIEGKEVKGIEFVNFTVPDKFGHFRGFTFHIKATLKDGTTISTEDAANSYWSDYTITYSVPNYLSRGIDGEILQSGFVDKDVITVTVACANDPSIKISKDVVLKYNEDVSFSYRNGTTSTWGNGGNAQNYRFEVKQVKHAQTGEDLLKIRITNVSESEVVSEFKMGVDQTLHFSCNGGNGSEYHESFGVGNGGNGGNITVIKDPSVKFFNFDYSNLGGNPGPSYNAVRGRDGSYREETRAINL